jgi:hypothetical protein
MPEAEDQRSDGAYKARDRDVAPRAVRQTWRRRLFRAWVVVTGVVALYILVGVFFAGPAGPFATEYIALAEPIFMALLVGGSLIWLAVFVLSGRKRG